MTRERDYTTGEVAKICGVSTKTASEWIDSGLLKGWRVPGSSHRRVQRTELARFLVEHGMEALMPPDLAHLAEGATSGSQ